MSITLNGDSLVWPRAWTGRFAARLRDLGLIGPKASSSDVHRVLSNIAANSYRAGSMRHPASGRLYPVFRSGVFGRDIRVITRPINDRLSAALDVQSELNFEGQTQKEIPSPTHKLADYVKLRPQPGRIYSGVYFIFKGGRLIYIGKALNFIRRLQQHHWCLRHMAVEKDYIDKYTVGFKELPANTQSDREKIRQIEKNLISKHMGKITETIAIANQRREFESDGEYREWG